MTCIRATGLDRGGDTRVSHRRVNSVVLTRQGAAAQLQRAPIRALLRSDGYLKTETPHARQLSHLDSLKTPRAERRLRIHVWDVRPKREIAPDERNADALSRHHRQRAQRERQREAEIAQLHETGIVHP